MSEIRNTKYEIRHNPPPSVVIVHDWLVGGGAERVVVELHKLYPDAPIYTSYCTTAWREKLDGKVVTGYLQHFGKYRKFLPLLQYLWFRSLDLRAYDIIISSSGNGMAKAARRSVHTTHINYSHTPVHYLWRHYDRYMERPGFGIFNSVARLGLKVLASPLRKLDYAAAQSVDYFIANSTHIQSDIKKYYKRESVVIHPPVDTSRFTVQTGERHGLITVGRLAPMKRVDLIVEACATLEIPLTIIGKGPELSKLQQLAGPLVQFVDNASDTDIAKALAKAEGFVFASYEDFGITPVEALASGTPVIAYKAGGALDYVTEGKTGVFFDKQTSDSLTKALQGFQPGSFKPETLRKTAEQFDCSQFSKKISTYVDSLPIKRDTM